MSNKAGKSMNTAWVLVHDKSWELIFIDFILIQPTISLEMPVPSQGHYGFHSFSVADWFCLFI